MDDQTKSIETPDVVNQPASTSAPLMTPITDSTPISTSVSVSVSPLTNKKSRKQLIMIIILAVISCAGIGFGIFGMIASSQAKQKSEILSGELEQKDIALKQVEEKLGAQIKINESAKDEDEEEQEEVTNVSVSAARDYIYIGEWGVKIKISDDLILVSYVFSRAQYPDILYISGATKDGQYVPGFLINSLDRGTGLVAVNRYSKNDPGISVETDAQSGAKGLSYEGMFVGAIIYEDDDYYFSLSRGNGLMGEPSETEWEIKSTNAVEKMVEEGISGF